MCARLEWRTGPGGDVILMFDADDQLTDALAADAGMISALLTDMDIAGDAGTSLPRDGRPMDAWGEPVISRLANGDVLEVDPELFWDGIHRLYRSRGVDYDSKRP